MKDLPRKSLQPTVEDVSQLQEEIKLSMGGKLNKLQLFIDNKIGEIRKLNDQLSLLQKEIELAEKEKEHIKNIMKEIE